ncbi:MAG: hypothetical protein WAM82_18915 [Thermoanaerobaculia bacterium]
MSRQRLSQLFGLLTLACLCICILVTRTSAATTTTAACPSVSCLTQTGYYQCVSVAGCTCHPATDYCVGLPQPTPTPTPSCPAVSCLTQQGYDECKQAGCGCDPKNDWCVAAKVASDSSTGN